MSAIAETSAPRVRARRRPMAGGVAWIVVVAALLAGVVAVNVVVLQLNVQLGQLGRERAELKADIAGARARLSTASAQVRIEDAAASQLGLVPADPTLTEYVRIQP